MPRAAGHRWLLLALAVFFFCSGLSALVYQVLWLRMLGWVFGVTIYAASAVWATFMAGLAIGSYAAGLAGDRVRNPLRWFGVTEMSIGATALATPSLLDALQQLYVRLYPSLPGGLAALTSARLIMAFAVLIVPTVLMGATLPLVLKASTFRSSSLAEQVGLLYGSNAAGAIVGTLAAGLYLIPELGIQRTFLVAASLNVLIGGCAVALSFVARPETAAAAAEAAEATTPIPTIADRPALRVILAVFTLSGAVSLALEVVWFRVLTLFLRPTVYGFSVMLATILAGICDRQLHRDAAARPPLPVDDAARRARARHRHRDRAVVPAARLPQSADRRARAGAVARDAGVPGLPDCRQPAGDFPDRAADGRRVPDRAAAVGGRQPA